MPTYILNESKMFSDIADGIAIVINSETGIYYGMNGFATVIFENLLSGASTEAVLASLKALPDAPNDMEERLNAFVERLKGFDIVLDGGNGSTAVVTIDPATAVEDEFVLMVEEYNDAQELLLADPIHEVKEESGWQPDKDALETDAEIVKNKEAKIQN